MERLNKYLAHAGVASRRQADIWIRDGRVMVNHQVVREMGYQIDPKRDEIAVDGRPLKPSTGFQYLVLHKPPGYLTTVKDPFGRPTVMDLLPRTATRLYPVGRLDLDTSGLLFFTNDGDLALALTHPRHLVEKIYRAEVAGIPRVEQLNILQEGVLLEDGITAPAKVGVEKVIMGNAIIMITIREGRKRQVKKMMAAIGHPVLKLERLAMGPLRLGDLPAGKYRQVSANELAALQELKMLAVQDRILVPSDGSE